MLANGVMAETVKAQEEENDRLAQALVKIAELVGQEVDMWERWASTSGHDIAAARAHEAKLIKLMVLAEMENAQEQAKR